MSSSTSPAPGRCPSYGAHQPRGTLVLIGGGSANRWTGGFERQLFASLVSPLASQNLRPLLASQNYRDLLALTDLIETGKVTPVIDRTYPPWPRPPSPSATVHSGQPQGKIVITI